MKQKWYEKSWLMWFCLIFLWPLGFWILYKKRDQYPQWKKIAGITLVICIGLNITSMNSTRTEPTAKQSVEQAAQKANAEVEKQIPNKITPAEKTQKPEDVWNKSEEDAFKNGNVLKAAVAVALLPNISNEAQSMSPDVVYKSPWDYYGTVIALSGTVTNISEFPPDSDFGKLFSGEKSTQISFVSENGVQMIAIVAGDTGNVQAGSTVTVYGYATGRHQGKNKLGGTTNSLILVGRV